MSAKTKMKLEQSVSQLLLILLFPAHLLMGYQQVSTCHELHICQELHVTVQGVYTIGVSFASQGLAMPSGAYTLAYAL